MPDSKSYRLQRADNGREWLVFAECGKVYTLPQDPRTMKQGVAFDVARDLMDEIESLAGTLAVRNERLEKATKVLQEARTLHQEAQNDVRQVEVNMKVLSDLLKEMTNVRTVQ